MERLVDAGFFSDADSKTKDNTVCFFCGLALCDWDESDNPYMLHLKHKASCAFVKKLLVDVSLGQTCRANSAASLKSPPTR